MREKGLSQITEAIAIDNEVRREPLGGNLAEGSVGLATPDNAWLAE